MFRNQYDSDITIWSPQGRIHQVEYAMEAVKQGAACVGAKSKTHVVLASLKRASSELGTHQKKIFRIDDHMGIAIAGLTADARLLCRYMRMECLNHKFAFEEPMQTSRLATQIADKSQVHTQKYGRRPYGVGLLIAGYDQTGPHLFETSPSGNFYDYKAQAIGARSQSAKTYLEKTYTTYATLSKDELIKHALTALRETLPSSESLTIKNCSIGVVGANQKFEVLEGEQLTPYLRMLETEGEQTTRMEE